MPSAPLRRRPFHVCAPRNTSYRSLASRFPSLRTPEHMPAAPPLLSTTALSLTHTSPHANGCTTAQEPAAPACSGSAKLLGHPQRRSNSALAAPVCTPHALHYSPVALERENGSMANRPTIPTSLSDASPDKNGTNASRPTPHRFPKPLPFLQLRLKSR